MITIEEIQIDNININNIVEDQQRYINDIDLVVYNNDIIVGYFVSSTPIFILVKSSTFTLEIAKAFLKYKGIDHAMIDHRDDIYPVRTSINLFEPITREDELRVLFMKRIEYESSFGLSSSDIAILYSAATISQNKKAKAIIDWLKNIRIDYFNRIRACNDAKYYDYDYSNNGNIPYDVETVLLELPPSPEPAEPVSKIFCAVSHTWQNFKKEPELLIIWDKIKQNNEIYQLKKDSIIINYTGLLEINYKVNVLNNEKGRVNVKTQILLNNKIIDETIAYEYLRSKKYGHTASIICPSVIIRINKGDKISLQGMIAYNDSTFGDKKNVTLVYGQSVITLKTTQGN